jgi:hypothetical protein
MFQFWRCLAQRKDPVTDPARQRQRERPQILALRGAYALGQTGWSLVAG